MIEEDFKNNSWSQEGEDVLINRLLGGANTGFYCDVGSHHPFRFSNTYGLYKRGWRGLTIDATPGVKELFQKYRPNDISVHCAVADYIGEIEFDCYNEGALNSAIASRRETIGDNYSIAKTLKVPCAPLSEIILEHVSFIDNIDLLSVDIEGYDEVGIRTFDFNKFRPKIVVVEIGWALKDLEINPITIYLKGMGYKLRSYLYLSAIFISE